MGNRINDCRDVPSARINENGQYRKTPRAPFLNYEEGSDFITICTKDKKHYFGHITYGTMQLSSIGEYCSEQLSNASALFPEIEIPLFVVMPNHIHAIVCVNKRRNVPSARMVENDDLRNLRSPNFCFRPDDTCQRHVPTLSRYINSFKGSVTKFARRHNVDFAWQNRYHDHLIHNTHDSNNIAEYIENNVARWGHDCFYNENA